MGHAGGHAPPISVPGALAFTRSLGDLHLQSWGVSHEPETQFIDLIDAAGKPLVEHPLALLLCSDGIWDNWKFEDISVYALEAARVGGVAASGNAQGAANELMLANMEHAARNFGPSADNMTVISMYLFPRH